jgi:4-carboxymuconolactone decarboxylase
VTDDPGAGRVPRPDPDHLTDAQRPVYDAIAGTRGQVRGPFLALLHVPGLAAPVQELGQAVRFRSALPDALRELAVLVTSRRWDAQFEWFAHAPIARDAGLSAATIEAILREERPTDLDARATAVHDMARELARTGAASDATYAAAAAELSLEELVELSVVVGYYSMLAMVLGAHDLQPEDGSRPLPPR